MIVGSSQVIKSCRALNCCSTDRDFTDSMYASLTSHVAVRNSHLQRLLPSNTSKCLHHVQNSLQSLKFVERALLYSWSAENLPFLIPSSQQITQQRTLQMLAPINEQPFPTPQTQRPLSQSSGFTFGLEEAENVVFADCWSDVSLRRSKLFIVPFYSLPVHFFV